MHYVLFLCHEFFQIRSHSSTQLIQVAFRVAVAQVVGQFELNKCFSYFSISGLKTFPTDLLCHKTTRLPISFCTRIS